jgi:hypothetical protein
MNRGLGGSPNNLSPAQQNFVSMHLVPIAIVCKENLTMTVLRFCLYNI